MSDLRLVVLLVLFILCVDLGVLVIVTLIYNVVHCNRQDVRLSHAHIQLYINQWQGVNLP